MTPRLRSALLVLEFVALFVAMPVVMFVTGTRFGIYLALWGAGLYAFVMLRRAPDFSWARLWHGKGWDVAERRRALWRFLLLAMALAVVTLALVPERFFRFPLDRFALWFAVMVLYPVLSIVPQELFYRSFYFSRYRGFVAEGKTGLVLNGLLFGFSHIVLNNWIAPSFCAVGGMLWAYSYRQHRSLKWAVIEHSLYGCWVFTVGIGYYFFTGNWRH